MLASVEAAAIVGLLLVRRLALPHIRFNDGVNDAISGIVATVGVFYGITVGLLAVGVWNTWSSAAELVSKEAAAIGAVYHDVSSYPAPAREKLQSGLREYTHIVVEQIWPAQKQGRTVSVDERVLNNFQSLLHAFEPSTASQTALHNETLAAYDKLIEYRRLRLDAVSSGLSSVMWAVIWVGAVISISVTYFYDIRDPKLHVTLVALMAGFLAIVIFTIGTNDKPFFGRVSIPPDSYTLILKRLIEQPR
jgi:hypothetical protein